MDLRTEDGIATTMLLLRILIRICERNSCTLTVLVLRLLIVDGDIVHEQNLV